MGGTLYLGVIMPRKVSLFLMQTLSTLERDYMHLDVVLEAHACIGSLHS